MRAPIAPLHLAEQDLAAAELEYITQASEIVSDAWIKAVLEWHCRAMAKARVEALLPGITGSIVEKRFRHERASATLRVLIAENLKLRHDLINALTRIRLHQRGGDGKIDDPDNLGHDGTEGLLSIRGAPRTDEIR